MPARRLDCEQARTTGISAGFLRSAARRKRAHWTMEKFSTEYTLSRSQVDSSPVASASVFLLAGWFMTHRCRRGTWPRHCRALVQSCRAAAGTPHRTVRNRPLAPLSQRTRVSRKHPGSQGRGGNLARSVDARGFAATMPRSTYPGSAAPQRRCRRARRLRRSRSQLQPASFRPTAARGAADGSQASAIARCSRTRLPCRRSMRRPSSRPAAAPEPVLSVPERRRWQRCSDIAVMQQRYPCCATRCRRRQKAA